MFPPLLIAQIAYVQPTDFRYPLPQVVPVSSPFQRSRCMRGRCRPHRGIDLMAPFGMPMLAAHPGRVVLSGWNGGYGNCVIVEALNSRERTLYAHASKLLVKKGQFVELGTPLGNVGSTGNSTGPHLHYEVQQKTASGWIATDPAPFLKIAQP